jgi:hypothetical protein
MAGGFRVLLIADVGDRRKNPTSFVVGLGTGLVWFGLVWFGGLFF